VQAPHPSRSGKKPEDTWSESADSDGWFDRLGKRDLKKLNPEMRQELVWHCQGKHALGFKDDPIRTEAGRIMQDILLKRALSNLAWVKRRREFLRTA